ncbi:MAG: lasso peptide biosynthesis protein [Acidobacteriota bacterium]
MRVPGPREVALFVHALRLSAAAQGVRTGPLPAAAARLAGMGRLPRGVAPEDAWRAAVRAGMRLARWRGALDSCLTRSLVVAALLCDRDGVAIHVGFRSGQKAILDAGTALHEGHAWVSVDGAAVTPETGGDAHHGPYVEVLRIPVRRR